MYCLNCTSTSGGLTYAKEISGDFAYLAAQALGLVGENTLKHIVHPRLYRVLWGGFVLVGVLLLQNFTTFVQ